MIKSAVRPTDDEITDTVKNYSNMLFKLCFTILCNRSDAEDAVSDTFYRYISKAPFSMMMSIKKHGSSKWRQIFAKISTALT